MFKRFSVYYKPYIGIIIFDLICAALTTVCELVFPMIVRTITNAASLDGQALLVSTVLRLGGLYLFLRIIDTFANYYMANMGHIMGAKLETDMRRDLFDHLQKLPFKYFDNTKIGQIMSRVTTDLFDVTEFSHHCPEEFFIAGIKIVGAFIILGRINWWFTLIIFLLLPLMLVSIFVFRTKMKEAFKEQRKQVGELNADLEDSLLGTRVVKSFANEDLEREKFAHGNNMFLNSKKKAYKYMALFQAGTRFSDGLMYIAVIVIGSLFMIDGKLTPADLIAYLLYIQTLITSIRRIVEFTEQFQKGITGIERFYEVIDEPIENYTPEDAVELDNVVANIEFNDVHFKYSDNTKEVLTKINLNIKKGENIAFVGPSGGGKTTLCNLIPKFYELTSGSITIDGVDISKITLGSLRNNIGMVQQDVYLFSGTVYENILYGKPDATRDEVIEAAKAAGAHDFIMELKDGYDTYVGERGLKLSGGQKQRVSIARLFLKNPPILILDEATSALDNESELLVQKSLKKLSAGRTTFTIAHRLTTIKNATRIFVLTADGIAEEGTHEELMSQNGEYAKLYSMYSTL
ncbi:MAG: ABC transporter ATP-binding protein [Ruminococcaceae bacterium]|nr:ABC transporter ATP-binding protein [Oscillospiraceae bacterium]